MRIALLIFGIFHLIAVAVLAAGSLFADGGGFFALALLAVVHPAAAVALMVALSRRNPRTGLVAVAVSLAIANIAGDIYVYFAFAIGGDFALPMLMLAIFPAAGAAYLVARRL